MSKQSATQFQATVPVPELSPLDHQFHRAQARLKDRKAAGDVKGGCAVRPLFQLELTGLKAKDDDQRIAEYEQRMARYTGVAV